MGITFTLNPYTNKRGHAKIMFVYSFRRKKFIFSTGMSVPKSEWINSKRRVKVSKRFRYAVKINTTLDELEKQGNNIVNKIIYQDKKTPTKEVFKDYWEAKNKDSLFWHSFDKFIADKKLEDLSNGALSNIEFLGHRLREIEAYNGLLTFGMMDQSFLDLFIKHCRKQKSEKTGEPYSPYTINTYISNLTSFLNYSFDREWHSREKFKRWKRPKTITKRAKPDKHLSLEELLKIEWIRLEGRHEEVRDTFVFMAFSGLRYGEYQSITKANKKGLVLEYTREKQRSNDSSATNLIAFNPEMLRFFDKYENLPKLNLKSFNDYLVEVAKMAGIEKRISSSWARHTFVTIGASEGISIQELSEGAGHSSTKITQTYNKSKPVRLASEKLSKRIKKKREAFIKRLG